MTSPKEKCRRLRRILIVVLLVVVAFVYVRGVEAKPYLTATCKDMKGPHVEYVPWGKGKPHKIFEQSEDRVGGEIVFVLEKRNSKVLLSFSKDSDILPDKLRRTHFIKSPLVQNTPDLISAIEIHRAQYWVHSLFPKLEFGIFARVGHRESLNPKDNSAFGTVFYAKCKFEK